jgi:hypothetical protein
MQRFFTAIAQLVAYFAVATLLAQILLLGVVVWKWDLTRDRLIQILALAQGVDLFVMRESALVKAEDVPAEQVSFAEIRATRAVKYRNLERREQALASGLAQFRTEQQKLAEERRRFTLVREAFQAELTEMREGAVAQGMDEVRRILETVKPQQAKAQLIEMLNANELDTVVALLAEMPDQKRGKIIGEFKTPQEQATIAEVLKRILEGVPNAELAAATEGKI